MVPEPHVAIFVLRTPPSGGHLVPVQNHSSEPSRRSAGHSAQTAAVVVAPVQVPTLVGPVGVSLMASLLRWQPDLATSAAGQATWRNVTSGLSAPWKKSKRQ